MLILPERFEDVKQIIDWHDPRSGWHITYLSFFNTDRLLPVSARKTDPRKLLWSPDEISNPDFFSHKAGFVWKRDEYGSVHVPHKDVSDFPLKYSVPAPMDSYFIDFPEDSRLPIMPKAETLIYSCRGPQLAEVEPYFSLLKNPNDWPNQPPKLLKKMGCYTRSITPRRKSDPDPDKITRKPRKPKPTRHPRVEPVKLSLERKLRLAPIPPVLWEQMIADGLRMNEIGVFRILYTFMKPPETGHRRSPGKSSLDSYCYTETYQAQISQMLKLHRSDILRWGNPDRKKQAEKMGTSIRTVKRATKKLGILGYHFVIYYGYPKIMERISPERQALRKQRSETVPQWGPSKCAIATDKRQQKHLKVCDRICRDHGVRPCLFNLQKILGKSVSL
ncbi:hypothetical protein ES703_11209 [subsurface metagenome]